MIQIAGIHDRDEADLVIAAGATHLGFPLRLPDGREDLSEAEAEKVIKYVGSRAECVLITYQANADEIASFARTLGVTGVQLHGAIASAELRRLRRLAPELYLIYAVVIADESTDELVARSVQIEAYVDAFLTDTFDPETGRRGATGKTHDWSITRELVRALRRPVIIAGGLNPSNVAAALEYSGASGSDAHTGVEGPSGRKDPKLVARFVAESRLRIERRL